MPLLVPPTPAAPSHSAALPVPLAQPPPKGHGARVPAPRAVITCGSPGSAAGPVAAVPRAGCPLSPCPLAPVLPVLPTGGQRGPSRQDPVTKGGAYSPRLTHGAVGVAAWVCAGCTIRDRTPNFSAGIWALPGASTRGGGPIPVTPVGRVRCRVPVPPQSCPGAAQALGPAAIWAPHDDPVGLCRIHPKPCAPGGVSVSSGGDTPTHGPAPPAPLRAARRGALLAKLFLPNNGELLNPL